MKTKGIQHNTTEMYSRSTLSVLSTCFSIFVLMHSTFALNVHQKCCGKNEMFDMDLHCVEITPEDDRQLNRTEDDSWWIPKNDAISSDGSHVPIPDKMLLRTLIKMNITYNSTPECQETSKDVLTVRSGVPEDDHFKIRVEKDELLLDVVKLSTLHDPSSLDNVTLRRRPAYPSRLYCLDRGPQGYYGAILCPCGATPCIRKCCEDSKFYNTTDDQCQEIVGDEYDHVRDWIPKFKAGHENSDYYRLVSRIPNCNRGYYVLRENVMEAGDKNKDFSVDRKGQVQIKGHFFVLAAEEYCGDATLFPDGTVDADNLLICLPPETIKFQLYGVLYLIGGVALSLSIFVILVLPDQKLYDLLLLCHNLSFVVAYFTTGIVQLTNHNNYSTSACKIVGFIIQFSFLAAFFWLNVMCIDISWCFSGIRAPQGSIMEKGIKKFIYYSTYAWGSTAIISIVTAIMEFSPGLPDWVIRPDFGLATCLFNTWQATLAYFYGPMALLLIANIALFLYTAARIISMRRETAILHQSGSKRHNKDKQRLNLYVKLFGLMGVSWVLEIVSWWFSGPDYLWYFTDIINLLRAVFIFVILCCKRTVYRMLCTRVSSVCPWMIPAWASGPDSKNSSSTQETAFTANGRKISSPNPSPTHERNRKTSSPNPSPNRNRKMSSPNPSPNRNRKISSPNPSPIPEIITNRNMSTPNPPRKISATNPPADSPNSQSNRKSYVNEPPTELNSSSHPPDAEKKMATLQVPEVEIE